jgi:glycosyltransferase involved in cell wall biosynthesis
MSAKAASCAQSQGSLVSVIVPAFNAEAWIAEAVKSVLAQTWLQIQVVVVDDGSQDQTANVVRSISDPRATLIRQNNCGAAAARNRGLAEAKGDFIQFLDADDLISEQKLEKQIEALQQAPVGSIASCAWSRFAADPGSAVVRPEPVWEVSDPVAWLVSSLTGGGMMHSGAWLTPRAVIGAAGPWEESLSLHDDGEFFTRVLLKAARNVFVPGAMVSYREVSGSLSRQRNRKAIESALAVCRSRHHHLLAVRDDRLVRRALATQYAQFAYEFAVMAPDLSSEALRKMQGLRTAPACVIGGRAFRWLSRLFGMTWALRARTIVARTGYADDASRFGR